MRVEHKICSTLCGTHVRPIFDHKNQTWLAGGEWVYHDQVGRFFCITRNDIKDKFAVITDNSTHRRGKICTYHTAVFPSHHFQTWYCQILQETRETANLIWKLTKSLWWSEKGCMSAGEPSWLELVGWTNGARSLDVEPSWRLNQRSQRERE